MSLAEATRIIKVEWDKKPTLSEGLAAKMRVAIGAKLDDSVTLSDLYYAGPRLDPRVDLDWQQFILGLSRGEKIAITHSLGGLSYVISDGTWKHTTVGDLRHMDDIKAFASQSGQNKSVFGLSFFKIAFERDVVEV